MAKEPEKPVPPPQKWLVRGGELYTRIEMKKADHSDQPGIPALGFILNKAPHMRRVMLSETSGAV